MQLYNKLSAEERRILIAQAGAERLAVFYQYHRQNPQIFRDHLFLHWNELEVLGRIYVAHEGINAQLSIPALRFRNLRTFE